MASRSASRFVEEFVGRRVERGQGRWQDVRLYLYAHHPGTLVSYQRPSWWSWMIQAIAAPQVRTKNCVSASVTSDGVYRP